MTDKEKTPEETSLEDVLKLMGRANEVFSYEIFVPSLNKNVMFREINTAQQKRLVKSIIDSPVYNTEFIFTLRQLMQENCTEKVDLDALDLFDKLFIALKMRAVSIGNEVEFIIKCEGCKKEIQRGFGLVEVLEKAKKVAKKIKPKTIKDGKGVYVLECSLPTIGDEWRMERELRGHKAEIDIKTTEELRTIVGDAFIGELSKYIKTVTIKESEDNAVRIDLGGLPYRERITIIEKLPRKLTEKVVDYINKMIEILESVTIFEVKCGHCEKAHEQRLKIDASFFTPSSSSSTEKT